MSGSETTATTAPRKELRKPPPLVPTQDQIEKEYDAELELPADSDASTDVTTTTVVEAKPEKEKPEIRAKQPKLSDVVAALHRREDETTVEWLRNLSGNGPIQIRIHRLKPQTFKGKITKGHLDTIEETIDEDELRDQWGGGQYQLRVMRKGPTGSWVFLTSTTVDIAGDPRTDNLPKSDPTSEANGQSNQPVSSSTETRALDMMEKQLDRAVAMQQRAPTGPDMAVLTAMMRPLELQIQQLTDLVGKKDDQLRELANKPQNPFQEKLLDKMIDGDSARVLSVRTALESEIRTVKEHAVANEKRLMDQFDRERESLRRDFKDELNRLIDGHKREIDAINRMHDQVSVAAKTSQEVTTKQLDGDIRRYERELTELRAEIKELRAKKDQTLLEKAKEMKEVKEALGVDDENEGGDKSTLERVADTVLQSDKLFDFAGKWFGPKQEGQQQGQPQRQQAMQHQPRVIRRKGDGQVFVRNEQNQMVPVRRRRTAEGEETNEMEAGMQIPPEQVAFAKKVLEQAFLNGTKPENVAATISTNLPAEIFDAIRAHGVDGFLNKVAKLEGTSPLRRQDGINWLRKLGKALLGEVDSRGQVEETPE